MMRQGAVATDCRMDVSVWAPSKAFTKVMQYRNTLSNRAVYSQTPVFRAKAAKPWPNSTGVGVSPTR